MSKQRYIKTKFWDDNYIADLDALGKLLFVYLLTNSLTTTCGIYEISLKRIIFDTAIDQERVLEILNRFEKDEKIKYHNNWIAIKNFIKHQLGENKNIQAGIKRTIEEAPKELVKWIGYG